MKVEGMPPQAMNTAANNVRNKEVSGNESEEQVKANEKEVKEKPENFGQFVSSMAKDKEAKAAFIAAQKEADNFGQAISAIARQGYDSYLEDINETSEEPVPEEVSTASSEPEAEEVSTAPSQPEPEEPSSIEVEIPEVVADVTPTSVVDPIEELFEDPDSQNEPQTS